jgi:hypothetical protein
VTLGLRRVKAMPERDFQSLGPAPRMSRIVPISAHKSVSAANSRAVWRTKNLPGSVLDLFRATYCLESMIFTLAA